MNSQSSDDQWPPIEETSDIDYNDIDNSIYAAFVKAFLPVLLYLANEETPINIEIGNIIYYFQDLPENVSPDIEKTNILRKWVTQNQMKIYSMDQTQIDEIMKQYNLQKLDDNQFRNKEYSIKDKTKKNLECTITMEKINPTEYYVDFLDGGKPYKVSAIIQYYKLMKNSNISREDWKTPLRNSITEDQEKQLEDLMKWFDQSVICTRSKRNISKKRSFASYNAGKNINKMKTKTKNKRKTQCRKNTRKQIVSK